MSEMYKLGKDVTEIKVSLARIDEHLNNINGTIQRHEVEISSMRGLIYKAVGAASVLVIIVQFILGRI